MPLDSQVYLYNPDASSVHEAENVVDDDIVVLSVVFLVYYDHEIVFDPQRVCKSVLGPFM